VLIVGSSTLAKSTAGETAYDFARFHRFKVLQSDIFLN
jgi:hypothetical protein